MTNQEVYNQIVVSMRTSLGRKCAAGIFIPDEKYSPRMEMSKIKDSYDGELQEIFVGIFEGIDINFLCEMQENHDDSTHSSDFNFFNEWIPKMIVTGENHKLDLSVFQEYRNHCLVGKIIARTVVIKGKDRRQSIQEKLLDSDLEVIQDQH